MDSFKGGIKTEYYYSYSGNTRNLATMIAKKSKGVLVEIVKQTVYPAEYHAVVEQAKKELEAGYYFCSVFGSVCMLLYDIYSQC